MDDFCNNGGREQPDGSDFAPSPRGGSGVAALSGFARLRSRVAPSSPTVQIGAISLVDQAVVSGTSFLTTVIVGRTCGADGLGMYALAFTVVVLISCGQESLISTPYAVYRARVEPHARAAYAGSVLLHFGLLAAIASLGFAAAAAAMQWLPEHGEAATMLWVLAGVMPLILLRELVRRLGFAHLGFAAVLAADATVAAVQLSGLALLAAADALSPATAYASMGLSCALAAAVWLALSRIPFTLRLDVVVDHLRRNLRLGRWIFAAMMALMLQLSSVQWLVAALLGISETGVFVACMSVVMLVNPFVQGVSNVLVPKTALAYADGGNRALRRVVWRATELVGLAMAGFCGVVVVAGEPLLTLLYGREYVGHRDLLILLAVALTIRSLSMPSYNGLQAADRADYTFFANLLGLVVTTCLALGLATPWGVAGAGWALLAGEAVAAGARWTAFRHVMRAVPSADSAMTRASVLVGPSLSRERG